MKRPARTLPLLAVTVSTRAGSDPDVIDASHDVYGDWPDIVEACDKSPTGQCQYSSADGHRNCIHCGEGDGVL